MLTTEQAALLMLVDPTFSPSPTMQGALQLAGLTDEYDRLTDATVERLLRVIRKRLIDIADTTSTNDCELHDIPIEGCCC